MGKTTAVSQVVQPFVPTIYGKEASRGGIAMSEQENRAIVQRVYQAFTDGDLPALVKLLADDVEWVFPPSYVGIPWSQRPLRGPDEVLQALRMITDALEFQAFQPDEFVVGRDSVAVLGHERCRVKATGAVVEAKWVQVVTVRDGKISRFREYSDTAAWDAGFGAQAR